MIEDDEQNKEAQVEQIFSAARKASFRTPPFMKTRVMTRVFTARKSWPNAWKLLALGSSAVAVVLGFQLFLTRGGDFRVNVDRVQVVQYRIDDPRLKSARYARIVLPKGVFFHSERFPQLKAQRNLLVRWNRLKGQEIIPFAIRASEGGKKTLVLKFYDEQNQLVDERRVRFQFVEGGLDA